MTNKKLHIVKSCVCVGLIVAYALPMLYLGEGSAMDAFFPYFITLVLIYEITPYSQTKEHCIGERRARIISNSFAVVTVIIPCIVFIFQGKEKILQISSAINLWRYYPSIVFILDCIVNIVIIAAYKRTKNKQK